MWFRRLEISQLRNLEALALELGPGLNYFHGDNGAGKTAVLEAVHLLARGRSFRTHQAGELIRRGASEVTVHGVVEDELRGPVSIGVRRGRSGRAELRIDGATGSRLSRAAELLPLQVLVPSLSELVFGAPGVRRQWLDWGVFHVEHRYLNELRSYLAALKQRNAVLKSMAAGQSGPAELEPWTTEVARFGEAVASRRRAYLDDLRPVAAETLQAVAPELEVELDLSSGWPAGESLGKFLGHSTSREVKLGATQGGPHRADIELRVEGLAAGSTLSRGQGKSLASALMLAQAKLLQRDARRASVFLIDDIGAELDLPHSERFFGVLDALGSQVLATSNAGPATLDRLPMTQAQMFHVEHGRIRSTASEKTK